MENVKYKICYWYHEYQDMSASVPTCDYYRQYGECPCEPECKHFITKREVDDIVRNMGKTGQTSDLISRQDAIKPFCVAPDGTRIPEVDCDNFPVAFSVEFIKKHLLSLPSAKAEWIPCSKGLPKAEYGEGDCVLTTCCWKSDTQTRWIEKLYFNGGNWCLPTGECFTHKVIAWKPLPTPYKGE